MKSLYCGIFSLFVFLMASCQRNEPCYPLNGTWKNSEGQKLVFAEGGKAALITYFGATASDTFYANINYACSNSPGVLDLLIDTLRNTNFKHHFFGLISWSSDTMFSLHMVKGRDAQSRPQVFMLNEAKQFSKE
jgi:hypothetical protein